MIGFIKNNRENYPRKCFRKNEKEALVKFNAGLSANRPSNNWALRWDSNHPKAGDLCPGCKCKLLYTSFMKKALIRIIQLVLLQTIIDI